MNNIEHTLDRKISPLEKAAYAFMAVVILLGVILAYLDEQNFRDNYVGEDGVLEYFTAILLFASAMMSLKRLLVTGLKKGWIFVVMTGLVFLIMLFGAGEEVSWGQRIFNIQSGEFFQNNNGQKETNLHNLHVNGVNINKLIFGKMLTLFLVLYYLILPQVYMRSESVRRIFDRLYIPVPKAHQGIATLIAGLSILLVASGKKGELNEVCLGTVFFLTLYAPLNPIIYQNAPKGTAA